MPGACRERLQTSTNTEWISYQYGADAKARAETFYYFPFGPGEEHVDVFAHIGHKMAIIFPEDSG